MKCLICGKSFARVCSHVRQAHNLSAREYKEEFGLDVKRGLMSEADRKIMREHTKENGTVNNLKVGKKFWFKPGSKIAGKYVRSKQTLERLSKIHMYNKNYIKKHG